MTTEVSLIWNHSNDFPLGPELNFVGVRQGEGDGIIQECLKIYDNDIL